VFILSLTQLQQMLSCRCTAYICVNRMTRLVEGRGVKQLKGDWVSPWDSFYDLSVIIQNVRWECAILILSLQHVCEHNCFTMKWISCVHLCFHT
jgi:hypothetical protein